MKLHKLTVYNFMPYKGTNVVEFPSDETRNIMLVFGDNMRGKTSLINSIRWAFYNKALSRHSREIQLQNIVNKDAAAHDDWRVEVRVAFEANGHSYDLRRVAERRPQVSTPTKPEDFIVSLYISKDGNILSGSLYDAELNQIAPEQVSRFFLFDGELLDQYEELLVEGSEQGRLIKEAIEQVLGVPSLINGRNELGAILKAAQKRQAQDMTHIEGLKNQAENTTRLTTELDAFEVDLLRLKEKLIEIREERAKLEDELESAARVLALKAKLDIARAEFKTQSEISNRKHEERKILLSDAWKDLLAAKLRVKLSFLTERQQELVKALDRRARLEGQVESIKNLLGTNECPICHQPLAAERRERLGTDLGKIEVKLAKCGDVLQDLNEVSSQINILRKIQGVKARERLVAINRDIQSAEIAIQKSENEAERLEDEIAGHDTAELARKRVLAAEKLKEEGRLTEIIKGVSVKIQNTKAELSIAQKAIEGLAGVRSQKSTQKAKIAGDMEKTFQTSIERLRDRLRKKVESLASQAFKNMTTQKAYRGLEINDRYGLSIFDSQGRKVSVRSAGAEHIVALSLIDGLNRTGRAIGPIIMDTPFGRLDPNHRNNILTYLPTVSSQFILLVHEGELQIETDLASVNHKVASVYEILEVTDTQSKIVRKQ